VRKLKTLLRVGIVVVLCGLALTGLWLHNRSLRLVSRVQALETHHRELSQEACSLRAEVNRLACYSRLESLWVAAGRPAEEGLTADGLQSTAQNPDSGPVAVGGERSAVRGTN